MWLWCVVGVVLTAVLLGALCRLPPWQAVGKTACMALVARTGGDLCCIVDGGLVLFGGVDDDGTYVPVLCAKTVAVLQGGLR